MSWLAESYRRCTFANQQAARMAHVKELEEKSRHLAAQEELATAREEVREGCCYCVYMHALSLFVVTVCFFSVPDKCTHQIDVWYLPRLHIGAQNSVMMPFCHSNAL